MRTKNNEELLRRASRDDWWVIGVGNIKFTLKHERNRAHQDKVGAANNPPIHPMHFATGCLFLINKWSKAAPIRWRYACYFGSILFYNNSLEGQLLHFSRPVRFAFSCAHKALKSLSLLRRWFSSDNIHYLHKFAWLTFSTICDDEKKNFQELIIKVRLFWHG